MCSRTARCSTQWSCRTTCAARSGWRTGWRCCGRRRSAPWGSPRRSSHRATRRCSSSWSAISRWPSSSPKRTRERRSAGSSMELSYKEEVSVGVMVIAGLVVFTIGMFWLTGRSLTSSGVTVGAEFANVKGLKEGDPVRVSGVRKGRVQQVQRQGVGRVTVPLQLSPDVRPHRDGAATVAAADFLGAMYVAYDRGAAPELLAEGKPIPGVTEQQFSDVAAGAATSAKELIENVNKGLNPGQLAGDIHATLIATQRGMKALTDAANGPTVKQTQQTLAALERVMGRLATLLCAPQPTTAAKRLDTMSVHVT